MTTKRFFRTCLVAVAGLLLAGCGIYGSGGSGTPSTTGNLNVAWNRENVGDYCDLRDAYYVHISPIDVPATGDGSATGDVKKVVQPDKVPAYLGKCTNSTMFGPLRVGTWGYWVDSNATISPAAGHASCQIKIYRDNVTTGTFPC